MVRKYVRFNYFEVQLVPAQEALAAELNDDDNFQYHADTWNMAGFLDYLMVNRETFVTTVPVGDEYAEIEKDSYSYDERRDLYSLQLSKLRENNIPSKKRLGDIKEAILLEQDEYIGEFVSLIFDNTYGCVALQSNLYGLSVKQTEHVLTQLRLQYLHEMDRAEELPFVVRLAPIIDRAKIQRIIRADFYKKVRIKGSNVMLDAELNDESLLGEARRLLHESAGVNFDITISLGRAERTATLTEEKVRELIQEYNAMPDDQKPQIELTALENEEAEIETVNLFEPRMTDRVSIEIEPRQTVAHEYLYQTFLEKYDTRRTDIRRVLVQI
ncbi:DUF6731 family protein [Lysinibacillus sphaericus]|uniref:DUF6731 family protein n=1 Tax=Lysinibacillus sphaericus TaxID=1421 RepID=UPI001CBDE36F|nr:DUF6731 family protein [Lysinibacillus sphaericus]